jgi:integrating conjugative element protein (TIGR03759 family)
MNSENKIEWAFLIILVLLCLSISLDPICAAQTFSEASTWTKDEIQPFTITKSQYSKLNKDQKKQIADMWEIDAVEYDRYLFLMQNTPSGKWYKQLNPPEVLGINAKDDKERMKYAKIVAKNAHERVKRELDFQKFYDKAQKILYPTLKPIAMPGAEKDKSDYLSGITLSNAKLIPNDILLFFTNIDNPLNKKITTKILKKIQQNSDSSLAIYISGKVSDDAIRHWAARNAIPPAFVKNGRISLNHENGKLKKLYKNSSDLPFILLDRKGEFKTVYWDNMV